MSSRQEQEDVVHRLVAVVPEFQPVLSRHLKSNRNELLPHVLFGDLTRWVIELYRESTGSRAKAEVLSRTIAFLEREFADPSNVPAQNLIAVSFLENLHQAGPDYAAIREVLGPHLKEELQRLDE